MEETNEKGSVNNFTIAITGIGLLLGGGGIFLFGSKTFIAVDTIAFVFLTAGLLAMGFHYLFLRKLNRYLVEVVIYCFGGIGSIVTALLLAANFLFHGPETIVKYRLPRPIIIIAAPVDITLNDSELTYFAHFRTFQKDEINGEGEDPFISATYTTAKGLFGYKVLLAKELLVY